MRVATLTAAAITSAVQLLPTAAAAADTVTARTAGRTLTVDGSGDDDIIWLFSPADDPTFITVAAGFEARTITTIRRQQINRIVVHGRAGNDTILVDETAGSYVPFTDTIQTTIHGDEGNDYLQGGIGNETVRGGPGVDVIDARSGIDTISGNAGDDYILWTTSAASDQVDGGAGLDTISLTGDGDHDDFTVTPERRRARIHHTGPASEDDLEIRDIETIDLNTLGGSDTTHIDDLSRTAVRTVSVDDGTIAGGDTPDDAPDHVAIAGTDRRDEITVAGDSSLTQITGMPTTIYLVDMNAVDVVSITASQYDTIDASGYLTDAARLDVIIA
jgi:Ca2+-binding RTX toxin-like protein